MVFAQFTAPVLQPQIVPAPLSRPRGYLAQENGFIAIVQDETGSCPLGDFVARERAGLEALLAEAGGILFRGFAIPDAKAFRDGVAAFGQPLLPYLERAAARTEIEPGVFTSTEFSSSSWIGLHHEMSFALRIPERIFFYAQTLAETGGETPVADEYRATARMPTAILDAFDARGLLYTRNFRPEIDMDWRSAFQTDDPADVEAYCRANDIVCEWLSENHLRTHQKQKAFVLEPGSNRKLFCNHAHLFHSAAIDPAMLAVLLEEYGPQNLPRQVYFGDGAPIPDAMIHDIRDIYADCLTLFSWQEHDVLLLNNARCLHGRAPFTGSRTTLVAMTNLLDRRLP
jgi:alpha-ketoglutarate-dependent taurine dioxygenase